MTVWIFASAEKTYNPMQRDIVAVPEAKNMILKKIDHVSGMIVVYGLTGCSRFTSC
mgnify:FL=1